MIELIHAADECRLELDDVTMFGLTSVPGFDEDLIREMISYMVEKCNLFLMDGDVLRSERAERNLELIRAKRDSSAKGGKVAQENRKNNQKMKDGSSGLEKKPSGLEENPSALEKKSSALQLHLKYLNININNKLQTPNLKLQKIYNEVKFFQAPSELEAREVMSTPSGMERYTFELNQELQRHEKLNTYALTGLESTYLLMYYPMSEVLSYITGMAKRHDPQKNSAPFFDQLLKFMGGASGEQKHLRYFVRTDEDGFEVWKWDFFRPREEMDYEGNILRAAIR